jgi:hypothetical protein
MWFFITLEETGFMQYTNKVLDGISVMNVALQELEKQTIFKNPDIVIDGLNFEDYLTLRIDKKNLKNIYYILDISDDGIEVHLDRIPEAFRWPYEEIEKDNTKVKNFIIMLLTSTVKADCYGSSYDLNYTKMCFYNNNGNCMHTVDRITGLLPLFVLKRLEHKRIIYEPFYEV